MKEEIKDETGYRELLMGCGNKRDKIIWRPGADAQWHDLICMDMDEACRKEADESFYVWDLMHLPYPFTQNYFDEIHAYEVLEHMGAQGDYQTFFDQFTEFHRIMKPKGIFCGTVPAWDSIWAWGDPGHTRVINAGTLTFLSQEQYKNQVGRTPMNDYRHVYKADFSLLHLEEKGERILFVLEAIK